MAFQYKAVFTKPPLPSLTSTDAARIIEQPLLFFLSRQTSKFLSPRIVRCQKGLFPMQHRWIGRARVIVALHLPGTQVKSYTPEKHRMRVAVEIRINQVGELPRAAMDFDDVRALDLT